MLFRSACLAMLFTLVTLTVHLTKQGHHATVAAHPRVACRLGARRTVTPRPPLPPGVTLVDVAREVPIVDIPNLVRLGLDEHVHAVDDTLVSNTTDETEARYLIRESARKLGGARHYIDVTIDGPNTERRVVVLTH